MKAEARVWSEDGGYDAVFSVSLASTASQQVVRQSVYLRWLEVAFLPHCGQGVAAHARP